jgi:hypothetical protein
MPPSLSPALRARPRAFALGRSPRLRPFDPPEAFILVAATWPARWASSTPLTIKGAVKEGVGKRTGAEGETDQAKGARDSIAKK